MSNVLTIDPTGVVLSEREKRIRYKCVLSGNYVQVVRGQNTGEVLDLTAVTGVGGTPGQFWGTKGPSRGYVLQGPAGFSCQVIPGADALHWLLKIFASPGVEHNAAGYEGAITADNLDFFIEFAGLGGGLS